MMDAITLSDEVRGALAARRPVVALESTLIAHGLPWPQNLETAREAEAVVRAAGAVPATVAVMDGRIRVGLDDGEVERVASLGQFIKVSRRELAIAVAGRFNAATTVSATLWVARAVGIGVMATGGLGGVHRGASATFDVSTDLDELARADNMLVVCSGFKSILDVPATLEALETRGVAIVGYRTHELPMFTAVSSGIKLTSQVETPAAAARVVRVSAELGLPGAVVLAQAVPDEVAVEREEMERAIEAALSDAAARGLSGKELTPFLLDRVRNATDGRSLRANRALIVANAGLAGAVAVEMARNS
jgi:pseudouridine-5'-phosphate glycosidase